MGVGGGIFGYRGGGGSSTSSGQAPGVGFGFITGNWYPTYSDVGANQNMTKGKLRFQMLTVSKTRTFNAMAIRVHSAIATTVVRMGIYSDTGTVKPNKLLHDFGTVATIAIGVAQIAITVTLAPGRYWIVIVQQGTSTTSISVAFFSGGTWLTLQFGWPAVPGTTSTTHTSWVSTAATYTAALPATAPALTITGNGTAPAVVLKAA